MSNSDLDTVSESGTYIIDDEETNPVGFKRYVRSEDNRHGTFDIHGLLANNTHRPMVDSKGNLGCSSSNSSLELIGEDDAKISKQMITPIKPSEAFGKSFE